MSVQPSSFRPDCDLFCRVIDNYGDIGVCWRLARQLHDEHGWQVRLWVDDIAACVQLVQDDIPAGIRVLAWPSDFPAAQPAPVVIEAFACDLPDSYLAAMVAAPRPPVWLNLEYLCVEDWGPGFHLQPSPHPRLPLTKYFFVPGILPGSGGILRETGLLARQAGFDREAARRTYAEDISGLWVFLFCYDNPALPWLLDIWAEGTSTLHCLVSAGKAQRQVADWLGQTLNPGDTVARGKLQLHALPFVPQLDFDTLLWTCDLNFVRGEDSLCRALWTALPFVWHIYPQQEDAHHAKLAAFHRHYKAPPTLSAFNHLWNGIFPSNRQTLGAAWQALADELPALKRHAKEGRSELEDRGTLCEDLLRFCKESGN